VGLERDPRGVAGGPRHRIAAGGQAAAVIASARTTFGALAAWCRPLGTTTAGAG